MAETRFYLSVEEGGRHLVVDGPLALLRTLLEVLRQSEGSRVERVGAKSSGEGENGHEQRHQ